MKIRTNKIMKNILKKYKKFNFSESSFKNHDVFDSVLHSGISIINDCYVLKKKVIDCKGVEIKDFPDLTGYECYINKINVDDYIFNYNIEELLYHSIRLAQSIENQLENFDKKFAIIINLQLEEMITSSVRFYKCRKEESWINKNIELYEEGILIKEGKFFK